MFSRRDRVVIDLGLAVLVFVGISSSISPWLESIYGEIAIWALIIGVPIGGLAVWVKGIDFGLGREVADSWKTNGEAVARLAALDAAHPEVARELSERMAEEKRRREQGHVPPVAPPKGL